AKKSTKWTCKACGEKQSFLREKSQPSESRWLKYLKREPQELELGGVQGGGQPLSWAAEPGATFGQDPPRKRKCSQSSIQPQCSLHVQDVGGFEVTWEAQGYAGLAKKAGQGCSPCLQTPTDRSARELSTPWWSPLTPAQQVKATTSAAARFPLPPGDSAHVNTEPPRPQRHGPKATDATRDPQAEQGIPRASGLSRPARPHCPAPWSHASPHLRAPGALHEDAQAVSWARGGPLALGAQKSPCMHLCGLFTTEEDFDDAL
ncbi:MRN complex-interacting protein, partial [Carlito syrichta]|uniref:MRN complex-interacting protein n=1 Tax=Carlito syrichta TaxID=1868482 RepID=A0A3Q0DRF6_CARSF